MGLDQVELIMELDERLVLTELERDAEAMSREYPGQQRVAGDLVDYCLKYDARSPDGEPLADSEVEAIVFDIVSKVFGIPRFEVDRWTPLVRPPDR